MNFIQAFVNKDGRALIPAYTVQSVWDDQAKFTYWIVNLHDFAVGQGTLLNIKLFHDEAEARAFAVQHIARPQ